jgi:hypothetical protein
MLTCALTLVEEAGAADCWRLVSWVFVPAAFWLAGVWVLVPAAFWLVWLALPLAGGVVDCDCWVDGCVVAGVVDWPVWVVVLPLLGVCAVVVLVLVPDEVDGDDCAVAPVLLPLDVPVELLEAGAWADWPELVEVASVEVDDGVVVLVLPEDGVEVPEVAFWVCVVDGVVVDELDVDCAWAAVASASAAVVASNRRLVIGKTLLVRTVRDERHPAVSVPPWRNWQLNVCSAAVWLAEKADDNKGCHSSSSRDREEQEQRAGDGVARTLTHASWRRPS